MDEADAAALDDGQEELLLPLLLLLLLLLVLEFSKGVDIFAVVVLVGLEVMVGVMIAVVEMLVAHRSRSSRSIVAPTASLASRISSTLVPTAAC